ncbi:Major facilitator superfamily domain general substrate transporter [Penicillium maclennaniae]|uniref:Major facilitator superfamily domain general substrate transporter n=1 Tax=Penicillium maclennaniae TaxID=1343394 RepID=UPI0025420118|nr:Major facilitator superfamily domain general substrate transporter [Penicillium maclennaniae]KAJ5664963.1 Major facilitator superfamily domain general substrate transporter [Penicillium maclennaniae]
MFGLVKGQTAHPTLFPLKYGRVLATWGLAGANGCLLRSQLLHLPRGEDILVFVIGIVSSWFGANLYFAPFVGANSLV